MILARRSLSRRIFYCFSSSNSSTGYVDPKIHPILSLKPVAIFQEKPAIMFKLNEMIDMKIGRSDMESLISKKLDLIVVDENSKKSFKETESLIAEFYAYIKSSILDTNVENLKEIADYYLSKEGKLMRPMINFLFGKLLFNKNKSPEEKLVFQDHPEYIMQKLWAAVIEILHVSSLLHDDIIDNSATRRGLKTAHLRFGKMNTTFSGNFMVGRAGRKICHLNNVHLFQVYSNIIDNLTNGEYIQAKRNKNFKNLNKFFHDYLIKSYYKTASLLAHSLHGVSIIANENELNRELAFRFGQHLGIAFQLIDDILDFTSSAEVLGKPNFGDLREGIITGPVLFALKELEGTQNFNVVANSIKQQDHLGEEQVSLVTKYIFQTLGIEKTKYLALLHIEEAMKLLEQLSGLTSDMTKMSVAFQGLKVIAHSAQPPIDINVDECLKSLMGKEGVKGYVIFNENGIPMKKSENTTTEKAVHYAALISDLWNVAKKIVTKDLAPRDKDNKPIDNINELEVIRLRTKQYTELIVSQYGEYTIICIQNCNPKRKEEETAVVGAGAESHHPEEKK